jgi:hypothetical protein
LPHSTLMQAIVSRLNALHAVVAAACSHAVQPGRDQLARTVGAAAAGPGSGIHSSTSSSIRWASSATYSQDIDAFGAPPALPQRRVVVTGIGMVSPLGVGVSSSWERLLQGHTGVRRLQEGDLPEVFGRFVFVLIVLPGLRPHDACMRGHSWWCMPCTAASMKSVYRSLGMNSSKSLNCDVTWYQAMSWIADAVLCKLLAMPPVGVGALSTFRVSVLTLYVCCHLQSHRAHMQQLPCQVVAAVPRAAADAAAAAAGVDPRRSSPFISFAQVAAAEVRQGFDVEDCTRFIAAVVLAAAWYRIHQPAAGLHLRGQPRMLLP